MKYKANCKINLHLKITGKLPNGYHELETVFQEIPFYDELEIESTEEDKVVFETAGLTIPPCEQNICQRAAYLLKERYGITKGCSIKLKKNVPIGAGLGGGSSDGACVLKVLNSLWKINAREDELLKMAVVLGADVPFFIRGGAALATGIGDNLSFIDPVLRDGFLVLVNPGIHIDTKKAYKNVNYNLTKKKIDSIFRHVLGGVSDISQCRREFVNDFEAYAFSEYAEIKELKDKMYEAGALFALMSGSGSSVYGFFKDFVKVEFLIKMLGDKYFVKVISV